MKKVSFCGISGSGMSALAQILKFRGYEVRGSDRSFDQGKDTENKLALENIGIKIFPQNGSAITSDLDCLYISSAVEEKIPDVKKALSLNIPIQKRSDLLAQIFNATPLSIAVGGTSGKTTTTAMIGYILNVLGQKPTVINGGLFKNDTKQKGIPNVLLGSHELCVAEADESDGSIEKYLPAIAVITNIGQDHKSLDELQKLFTEFALKASMGVVANADCALSAPLLKLEAPLKTFSIRNPGADIYLSKIKPLPNGLSYVLNGQEFKLQLPGVFNAANAAAAFAACAFMGILPEESAKALEGFLGTKRRLDIVGTKKGITIIDDFAHNPDKVRASISALRNYEGRLLVMFQAHGFSPMRMMGREIMQSFAKTLQKSDKLFMPEIFYVGGTVTRDISSKDLIDYASSLGVDARFYQTRDEIKEQLTALAQEGDRIVIMGARDNTLPLFCKEILENL